MHEVRVGQISIKSLKLCHLCSTLELIEKNRKDNLFEAWAMLVKAIRFIHKN